MSALGREVARDGKDPGVVVAEPESRRQHCWVGVVQLDPDDATAVTDRQRLVQPTVGDPQVVEHPERGAREVPELGVGAFGLQLGDDDHREHDLVLVEPHPRGRVGQQHRGVENEGPTLHSSWPPAWAGQAPTPVRRYDGGPRTRLRHAGPH